jgi:hypothetical protein
MDRPAPRPFRRGLALALVLALAACLSDTVSYTPPQDDVAMATIERTLVEQGPHGLVLSICEDRARTDAWTPPQEPCQVDHVVRGGGRGIAHEEDHGGGGCGGCPFTTVAYVRATADGGGLAAPLSLVGEVTLGDEAAPYRLPYSVSLTCENPGTPCELSGVLREDGGIEATLVVGVPPSATTTTHPLSDAGAAGCVY